VTGGAAFKAVADPTRRAMLDLLRDRERSVSDLCDRFDVSQPAISQHLKVLHDAGLVSVRQEGRVRYYRLEPMPLREIAAWIEHYEQFWDEKLGSLGAYLSRKKKR
jgi:DNA-binding transcriptional ArsR family regulator